MLIISYFSARRKPSFGPHHILQRLSRVAGHIKGTVQRGRQRIRRPDQPFQDVPVQGAVWLECADHNTICPQVFQCPDVLLHLLDLYFLEKKVPKAWADQNTERDLHPCPDLSKDRWADGGPADRQIRTDRFM